MTSCITSWFDDVIIDVIDAILHHLGLDKCSIIWIRVHPQKKCHRTWFKDAWLLDKTICKQINNAFLCGILFFLSICQSWERTRSSPTNKKTSCNVQLHFVVTCNIARQIFSVMSCYYVCFFFFFFFFFSRCHLT